MEFSKHTEADPDYACWTHTIINLNESCLIESQTEVQHISCL